MKILGIDYGRKKIGLAISDEGGKIALPFSVIKSKNPIPELVDICKNNNIKDIIMGLPKTMRGEVGQQAEEVKRFSALLKEISDVNIIFEDERLSSSMAGQFIEKNRREDDIVAAQIILQDYLDKKNR